MSFVAKKVGRRFAGQQLAAYEPADPHYGTFGSIERTAVIGLGGCHAPLAALAPLVLSRDEQHTIR